MTKKNADKKPYEHIFCACDVNNLTASVKLADSLRGVVGGLKLGHEFLSSFGPLGVEKLSFADLPIFLDTKFLDIPNTVSSAIKALAPLKPFMLNVHAMGGEEMMKASVGALDAFDQKPMLIAVTVLTSMNETDLQEIGIDSPVMDQVRRLAELTQKCGLDGVVCSPHEIDILRADRGDDFKLITPGIRPKSAALGDQKRVMTPAEALEKGSDYLVIGRPITQADDPRAAAQKIFD
ncbi:MAG: orotidine-5'-phosphate decarboxylase [Alphaproteobacteria bacterium]